MTIQIRTGSQARGMGLSPSIFLLLAALAHMESSEAFTKLALCIIATAASIVLIPHHIVNYPNLHSSFQVRSRPVTILLVVQTLFLHPRCRITTYRTIHVCVTFYLPQ